MAVSKAAVIAHYSGFLSKPNIEGSQSSERYVKTFDCRSNYANLASRSSGPSTVTLSDPGIPLESRIGWA